MIRLATEKDVPEILEIYAPYVENTTVTFEYDVPCRRSFLQRFYEITAQFPWLVYEEAGKVLGYAYASRPWGRAAYSWNAEISIYLHPDIHGRGIGRKLCAALEHLLKLQGYRIIYSVITSDNLGSIAFHKKIGYKYLTEFPGCGHKFGRVLGTVWLEKRVDFVEYPHEFPVPCRSLVENDGKLHDILAILSLS